MLEQKIRAAPSLCGGSLDSRAIFLKTKLFFLKPCRGTVDILCKHLSPGDESAYHPNPKSLRQVERILLMLARRFGERQLRQGYVTKYDTKLAHKA
jgi:hypothetical protein